MVCVDGVDLSEGNIMATEGREEEHRWTGAILIHFSRLDRVHASQSAFGQIPVCQNAYALLVQAS